ncbi:hypothetical protein ZWY2020_005689 [Hordeum vulgare]|nr:hypothetical protein ZWY2020_005689 [Hordeum vulgare]
MERKSGRRLPSSAQIGGALMEVRPGRRLRSAEPQLCSPSVGGGGEPDRISSLPDELILLILTLIGCTATAARTSVLSRRWRDLWIHLRRIVFHNIAPSAASAIGRVRGPAPAVSLLEVRIPSRHLGPFGATASRLLRAAVRLEPEEIVLSFPWSVEFEARQLNLVRLPCFRRTTSLTMERLLFYCPDGEGEFTALRTLSISYGLGGLHSLLPRCPHLRVLSLKFVNDGFGLVQNGSISLHLPSLQELLLETSIVHTDAIDIVAPLLKRLTVSFGTYKTVSSIAISAPMADKVSWEWWYFGARSSVQFGLWSLQRLWLHTGERGGQLPSLHIHASRSWFISNEDTFAQEVEKHMVYDFSVLELHLLKSGHVFGALVFHLLGIIRLSRNIQRLKIVLEKSMLKGKCSPHCTCEPTNWRSQTISLTALEELEDVKIDDFRGEDHEFDFLEMVFRCTPMLGKMTVKQSNEFAPSYAKILDVFKVHVEFQLPPFWLMHGSQISPLT